MKVWEVMNKKPFKITPKTSFSEVWNLLFKKRKHALPVVNKENILLGIVAMEDVMKQLYPSYTSTLEEFLSESTFEDLEGKIDEVKNKKAEEFMNANIICCYKNDAILKAFSKMILRRVRQLPVIDDDTRLIGIVSKRDIFDKFFLSRRLKRKKE